MPPSPVDELVLFHLGPLPVTGVIVATWLTMGLLVALAGVVRLRLRRVDPGPLQQVLEALVDWMRHEVRDIIRRDPAPYLPLVASLFLFIFLSNVSGQVTPLLPGLRPPTADLNTTAALATVVFVAVPLFGIASRGVGSYLKTYLQPTWILLPFNIISELSRTLALAMRLFGNVMSADIIVGVLIAVVPFLLPVPMMFLTLVTGTVQAYIFTVLAIVYIGGAVRAAERTQPETKEETT
jgi:F-type H+-transporting ATPase subunit a